MSNDLILGIWIGICSVVMFVGGVILFYYFIKYAIKSALSDLRKDSEDEDVILDGYRKDQKYRKGKE